MLIKMAFKNIFRNRKRTSVTIAAIFFGVLLTIVFNGFNSGLEWQMRDLYIKTYTSDLKVVANNYKIDEMENPLDYPIHNYKVVEQELDQNQRIKAFSSRVSFQGSLNNGVDEVRAMGIGIDPVVEDAVFHRSQGIVSGSFLKPGEEGIVIGANLAGLLNLKVGDTVSVVAQATQMGINAYDLEIRGLICTGNPMVDGGVFFVPKDFAHNFLSFNGITDVAVSLKDHSQLDLVTNQLKQRKFVDKTLVLTWRDFAADFMQIVEFRKRMIGILSIMVLLIAGVGIVNTMLMSMLERKQEIGILMALGVQRMEIIWLFLLEGGIIGLLGSLAAAIIGSILLSIGQTVGIPMDLSKIGNTPIAGKLYFYLNFIDVFRFLLSGIVVSALATVYPAIKSAQLKPVEAIAENRR